MREPDATLYVRETGGSILFRWLSNDTDHWQRIRADLKLTFPHWTNLRFDGEQRMWRLPLHMRSQFCHWANAWFGLNGQKWETLHEQTGSSGSSGPQSSAVASIEQAYAALHLRSSAPLWAAEAVYRAGAKLAHPDAGGDHTAAVVLNQAIAVIRDAQPARTGAV